MDKAEFTRAIEGMLPALYRVSASILRSRADAEDAVQQALLKAWASRDRLRADTMRAYVTRIAVNECRNIQRYRMRVTPVDANGEDAGREPAFDPSDHAVREALDALREDLRTPLLLKYMEGYSEREAASALNLALPAFKSRLYRARKELKKLLTDWEVRFQ